MYQKVKLSFNSTPIRNKVIFQFMVCCQPAVPLVKHVIQILKRMLFQVILPSTRRFLKLYNSIGEFHQYYYLPSIARLVYHQYYYKFHGKNNVASIRQHAFQSLPGSIATRFDYYEKFSFFPDVQLQGE